MPPSGPAAVKGYLRFVAAADKRNAEDDGAAEAGGGAGDAIGGRGVETSTAVAIGVADGDSVAGAERVGLALDEASGTAAARPGSVARMSAIRTSARATAPAKPMIATGRLSRGGRVAVGRCPFMAGRR